MGRFDLDAAFHELHEYASRADRLARSSVEEAIPQTGFILRVTNGHALGPFLILARLIGIEDGEAFRAWQAGEREAIIARAKGP